MSFCRIFLFLLLASPAVVANDDEAKYKELCERDSYCTSLRESDGTWRRPSPEILAFMKEPKVHDEIMATAKRMNVDPVAIAASILTENSLNVNKKNSYMDYLTFGKKNDLENYLAQKGVTSLPGKGQFSFGFGQIHLDTAEAAEAHAAELEHRQPKTADQLREEILDPLGSIRVAGEIIRKAQDDYKAKGFDISKNPELLATLYNLGRSEKLAEKAKEENRLPQVNYFGFFVQKYQSDITAAVNKSSSSGAATALVASSSVPAVSNRRSLTSSVSSPSVNKSSGGFSSSSKSNSNFVKVPYVTRTLPLVSAPLLCDSSDFRQDSAGENSRSGYGAPVGAIDSGEAYTEINRTLDCNASGWTLIRSSSGSVGWVRNDTLASVKSEKYQQKENCDSEDSNSCRQQIQNVIKDYKIDSTSKDGLTYLKPIATHTANFKHEDMVCGYSEPHVTRGNNRKASHMNNLTKKPIVNDLSRGQLKELVAKLRDELDQELKRMSKDTGVPERELYGPTNPYNSIATRIRDSQNVLEGCFDQLSSEAYSCRDPRGLEKAITILDRKSYERRPDLDQVMTQSAQVEMALNDYMYGGVGELRDNIYEPTPDEFAKISDTEIKSAVKSCQERVEKLEKSDAVKNSTGPTPQNSQMMSGSYPGGGYYPYNSNGMMTSPYGSPNGRGMIGGYNSYGPTSNIHDIFDAVDKASATQIEKYKTEFFTFAKACHAHLNLVDPNPVEENKSQVCIKCAETSLFIFTDEYNLQNKDIMAKYYKQNSVSFLKDLKSTLTPIIEQDIVDDINPKPIVANQPQDRLHEETDGEGSYCPRRTAEFIENLLKYNPCVKRVYVPTRFLSNKLSGLGEKIIYRQFEEGDRYAIDLGDESCK